MKSLFGTTSLFVLMTSFGSIHGQTYTMTTYQAEYVSVGVGFPLTEDVWDDPQFTVPLGYSFSLFENLITDLNQLEDYSGGGVLAAILEGNFGSVIGAFGPDIIDRGYYTGTSASAIYFTQTGTPGQRVFIQEWLNVGFANGDTVNGMFTDYVNFQLQLHEATYEIILHFGTSSITNPLADYEGQTGPSVGLLNGLDLGGLGVPNETMLLSGNPTSPTIITEFVPAFLNGTIPPNTVYRFKQAISATEDDRKSNTASVFYPNPANGELHIQESYAKEISYPLHLFSGDGTLVKKISDVSQLNVYDLPAGVYTIRYNTVGGWNSERLVVMD